MKDHADLAAACGLRRYRRKTQPRGRLYPRAQPQSGSAAGIGKEAYPPCRGWDWAARAPHQMPGRVRLAPDGINSRRLTVIGSHPKVLPPTELLGHRAFEASVAKSLIPGSDEERENSHVVARFALNFAISGATGCEAHHQRTTDKRAGCRRYLAGRSANHDPTSSMGPTARWAWRKWRPLGPVPRMSWRPEPYATPGARPESWRPLVQLKRFREPQQEFPDERLQPDMHGRP
jgi:hypothetical protein